MSSFQAVRDMRTVQASSLYSCFLGTFFDSGYLSKARKYGLKRPMRTKLSEVNGGFYWRKLEVPCVPTQQFLTCGNMEVFGGEVG